MPEDYAAHSSVQEFVGRGPTVAKMGRGVPFWGGPPPFQPGNCCRAAPKEAGKLKAQAEYDSSLLVHSECIITHTGNL